jgi:hypothetical protein
MSFVYHLMPEPMIGKVLYPLNEMEARLPAEFRTHSKKYEGREELMNEKIPLFNCRWNDVLHFSPINPQIILKEITKINPGSRKRKSYLKFKASALDDFPSAYMTHTKNKDDDSFNSNLAKYELFSSKTYKEIKSVPNETIRYWQRAMTAGKPMYWFIYVPHVLVKSHVSINEAEICNFE